MTNKKDSQILWFDQIDKDDLPWVGGKGANLGEMTSFGIPVPSGFAVTATAYFDFIRKNQLEKKIKTYLKEVNPDDPHSYSLVSQKIKKLIQQGRIDPQLSKKIIEAYLKLGRAWRQALVAIRSSATAEDLPTASFAGQQETFLNVKGEANVVTRVKDCWASLFEPRAIFYREEKNFPHLKVGIAVMIQEMVSAEVSGVMFTVDPVSQQKNTIVIEAIYGLGEYIVQGKVTPDQYLIKKRPWEIIDRQIAKQLVQLTKVGNLNRETKVPKKLQLKRKLTDKQILELAQLGEKIQRHYFYPQDIEWVLYKNKFCIVQTRPITTIDSKKKKAKKIKISKKPILTGQAASPGFGTGPVKIIKSVRQIGQIKKDDILVTSMTTPDFVPAMKKVAAIITDKGGQTSHAAIVSRELGIPCVVGTQRATQQLKDEQIVTVNGAKGEVYRGGIDAGQKRKGKAGYQAEEALFNQPDRLIKTATKIYLNLGEPELAATMALKNVDGIGLLRAEFMMAQIGIHPKKLIKDKKQSLFSHQLAEGLNQFCQAFYPRPVVYRTSDFKTNEYRNLVGGQAFEPEEENPLLGYRGAFRYLHDEAVFELELAAIKKTREKFNNLWLMVPFCRTPQELTQVKKIVSSAGLIRSTSFQLWLMVEIPSNVILLEEFIKVGIDGVSVGSNDLTMLLLGIDRDNEVLAAAFNEQDRAVAWALERTIKTCQKHHISSSICGQAASVYADLVENLIKWGITSLSINPDAIDRTRELVHQIERRLALKGKK